MRTAPLLLALLGVSACRDRSVGLPEDQAPTATQASSATRPELSHQEATPELATPQELRTESTPASSPEPSNRELASPTRFVDLDLPGFQAAVVALPLGTKEARPIVVALHGNFDRPEWQCEQWAQSMGVVAFVVCPRGERRSDAPQDDPRFTFGPYSQVRREVSLAIDALIARYPQYVDQRAAITLVGFSLGASHAARLLGEASPHFGAALLIEGGYAALTRRAAKSIRERRQAVVFICAQTACRNAALPWTKLLGELSSTSYAANAGHTYTGRVAELAEPALRKLVALVPRFR